MRQHRPRPVLDGGRLPGSIGRRGPMPRLTYRIPMRLFLLLVALASLLAATFAVHRRIAHTDYIQDADVHAKEAGHHRVGMEYYLKQAELADQQVDSQHEAMCRGNAEVFSRAMEEALEKDRHLRGI